MNWVRFSRSLHVPGGKGFLFSMKSCYVATCTHKYGSNKHQTFLFCLVATRMRQYVGEAMYVIRQDVTSADTTSCRLWSCSNENMVYISGWMTVSEDANFSRNDGHGARDKLARRLPESVRTALCVDGSVGPIKVPSFLTFMPT